MTMRKVLIFALTVAIALGGLGFAHAAVTDSQDDLLIYPTLEVGDRSRLDGMTASMTFACGDHLRWHTDYTFGGETATEFRYHRKPLQEPEDYERTRLSIGFSGGFGASTSGYFSVGANDYGALFQAVAVATPDGGTKTMNLNMADYVNYYMSDFDLSYMSVNLHSLITDEDWYEWGNYHEFTEHFRFPVQDHHIVSVTVGKDASGRINDINLSPENGPLLYFISDVNAEGLWFVPVFKAEDGTPLPYESPAGHGIYFIPWKVTGTIQYTSGEKETVEPDLDNARRLFPLDDNLIIEHMEIDAEAGEAWMLTREDTAFFLTSYDLTAGQVLARLEVLPHDPEADAGTCTFERDGDYLLVTAQNHIALVDTANRALLLTAPDTAQDCSSISYTPETGTIFFDGEYLILLDVMRYWDGTFWTAVFRQDELTYYGEYDCSLMRGNDDFYYSSINVDQDPITLK